MLFVATRSHPFLISLRTAAAVARFHAAHNEKMAHLRQGDSSFLAPHLRQRFSSLGAARTGDRVLFLSAERLPWGPALYCYYMRLFQKVNILRTFLLPVVASYGQLRPVVAVFGQKGEASRPRPSLFFLSWRRQAQALRRVLVRELAHDLHCDGQSVLCRFADLLRGLLRLVLAECRRLCYVSGVSV